MVTLGNFDVIRPAERPAATCGGKSARRGKVIRNLAPAAALTGSAKA
jgi:hypothetical protein